MNEFWIGAAAGAPAGVALTALAAAALWRYQRSTVEQLTDQDREVVAEEFRTHAEAMQRQVSEYGDALAAGDLVLRERLRRFEGVQ